MYTLYDSKLSGNAWKVRQTLHLLGIPYERRTLNLATGEARTPEFLHMNPWGRIPVLTHSDGRVFTESNAILLHLARESGLVPRDTSHQQRMLEWLFIEQADHFKNFANPRFLVSIAKTHAVDAPDIAAMRAQGEKVLARMDACLENSPFLAGDALSLADIALFPYTSMAPAGGYVLDGCPHVAAWLDRVQRSDGFLPLPH